MIELVPRKQYEQIKATLRQRAHRIPLPPFEERFDDFLTVGIYHFIGGAQDFARWSREMQEDFGESIRPHFQEIWLAMPCEARNIADRLMAPILKQSEIAEILTAVSRFAKIKPESTGKHTSSPQQQIRSAALMPPNEIGRIVAEPGEEPRHQAQAQPISQRKLEPEVITVPAGSPGGQSYQCPSCGRSLRRSEVMQQEWGDKAEEFLSSQLMAQASEGLWDFALENFKAFHECVPAPTEGEILRNWKKLALRRVLRYILVGWAVLAGVSLFSDERMSMQFVLFQLVACCFFFVVVVPLFVALSIPLADMRFRNAWAREICNLWEEWKSSLVAQEKRRNREMKRVKA